MTPNSDFLFLFDSFDFTKESLFKDFENASNISAVEINSYKSGLLKNYNHVIIVFNNNRDSLPKSLINDIRLYENDLIWIGPNYDKISNLTFEEFNSGITTVFISDKIYPYSLSEQIYAPLNLDTKNIILYGYNGHSKIPMIFLDKNVTFISNKSILKDFSSEIPYPLFEIPIIQRKNTTSKNIVVTPSSNSKSELNLFSENISVVISLSIVIVNISLLVLYLFFRRRYKKNLFSKK